MLNLTKKRMYVNAILILLVLMKMIVINVIMKWGKILGVMLLKVVNIMIKINLLVVKNAKVIMLYLIKVYAILAQK
jgi:hypothetical protein